MVSFDIYIFTKKTLHFLHLKIKKAIAFLL